MTSGTERARATRLLAWTGGVSVALVAAAFALTVALPAGAEGLRAALAWCGIGA